MRSPSIRGIGFVSAWGPGAAAIPADARAAAGGRPVLTCRVPERAADRRRRTREGSLALSAVDLAIRDGRAEPGQIAGDRTALVYVTAAAYAASNRRFIEGRGGSIHFAETAPAVVSAEVSIDRAVSGPYAIFIGGPPTTLRAIWHAATLLDAGACDRALVLTVEIFEECADLYAGSRRLAAAPLVEAAGCVWLEPGVGELGLSADAPRAAHAEVRRRLGETFSCEPIAALALWRLRGEAGTLDLGGCWRGDRARLVWTEPLTAAAA